MADKKITELTELTAVATSDMCLIVDDPSGSAETKKITRNNLIGSEDITMAANKQILADDTAGVSAPPIAFDGDDDTGVYRVGANQAGFGAGGVKQGGYDTNGMLLAGNRAFINDVQLTGSTDDGFPNTTTTYIWNFDSGADGNQTDVVGSKVLTRAGANALTASNDVLGVSRYNTCGADTELTSTDTAFNIANTADTDDFILGGWFYIPDMTPAANVVLGGNTTDLADHGYALYIATDGILRTALLGATDQRILHDMTNATIGWYHIVFAREVGVAQYLFVNGNLVGKGSDATIGTTQTKFQFSGYNHSNSNVCESGTRLDEIFFRKGVLPTNLSDVIRNIYSRSAKKFAVKDQAGNVMIEPPVVSSGTYLPIYTAVGGGNVDSCTPSNSNWIRVGDLVSVTGTCAVDFTAAATQSYFQLSLPITSAMTDDSLADASGTACTSAGSTGYVYARNGSIRIEMTSATNGAETMSVSYSYILK